MGLLVAVVSAETLPDTAVEAWSGSLEQRTLDDGSVLSEYVSSTEASNADGGGTIELSVTFIPRFGCSPLIGLRFSDEHAALVGELFADGDSVALTLDDEAFDLPLAVDESGDETKLWFFGSEASQREMRARLDVGSGVRVAVRESLEYGFSLLGSQHSIEATEEHCLLHEPISYEQ